MMWFDAFNTPIGQLTIAGDDAGLRHVLFPENKYDAPGRGEWRRDSSALRTAREQLVEYLEGARTAFELPLAPTGTTFQVKVWTTLAEIPFGQTWSYAALAARIGSPRVLNVDPEGVRRQHRPTGRCAHAKGDHVRLEGRADAEYFNLPPNRVAELDAQIEL